MSRLFSILFTKLGWRGKIEVMELNLIISPKNRQLQKQANQLTQNWDLLESMIINICSLCGIKTFSDRVPINLIYGKNNKEIFAWFSWTPKNSMITIEFSRSRKVNNQFMIMVLVHELFHLVLRKNKKLMRKISKHTKSNESILKKIKEKNLSSRMILEELIISSFVPEGYLSKKYFNKSIKLMSSESLCNELLDWRRYIAHKMQRHAQLYSKRKQIIDDTYINKIINVIKNHKKKRAAD